MSADQPPPPGSPPFPDGKRKPPTIDLTATEVEARPAAETAPAGSEPPAPVEGDVAAASSPEAATSSEPASEAASESVLETAERSATEPPTPPPPPPPASPQPRRTGFAPLFGAGIVGGAIAAGLLFAANMMFAHGDGDIDALRAQLAALELKVGEIAAQPAGAGDTNALSDIAARLAKLEAAVANPRPAPLDPSLANRISALEGQLKAMGESIGVLARRNDEIAAIAGEARARAEATAAALAELTTKLPAQGAVGKGDLDALAARVGDVERASKALAAEVANHPPGNDRASRLAAAAAALKAAVERGDPFAPELAAATAFGPDPQSLAALAPFAASGLPSAVSLARELSDLTPALRQAAGIAPQEGGFLERLQSSAEKLVRIRRVEEVPGSDPAAIIARIDVKAARADLAGALAELASLPDAARAPAQAWIKKAQARAAAVDAARKLSADALAGLGK
jgi:hypothetical protein